MSKVAEINKSIISKKENDLIDAVEYELIEMTKSGDFVKLEFPLKHIFTEGLYAREITVCAGARLTSQIHITDHQFIVSKGRVLVYNNGEEIEIVAPYHGITKAGTRRVLAVIEDTIWTTFHANPKNETVEQIEDRILEKHENKLLK
jgi:hypothetical protein